MSNPLQDHRTRIQTLDWQIVNLIDERMKIVRQIAELKKESGLAVFDSSREDTVMTAVMRMPHEHIGSENLKLIFQSILEISRNIQQALLDNTSSKDSGNG